MASRRLHRVAAVVVVSLLLATPPVAAVSDAGVDETAGADNTAAISTATDGPTSPFQQSDATGDNVCFPAGGYNFTIGTLGPQIEMVVHLSLLTNLGGPGTIGIELAGTTAEDAPPMIELRTGVVFRGVTDVERFLSDPFGLFAIAYEYRFTLPLGGGGVDYQSDEPPISGPVGNADCS